MNRIDKLIEGLLFIRSKDEKADFDFQHDVMYVGDTSLFSDDDKERLEMLDFSVDEEVDSFSVFS